MTAPTAATDVLPDRTCAICRQPPDGQSMRNRGPIVRCNGDGPWHEHCTTCQTRCGECRRASTKPEMRSQT